MLKPLGSQQLKPPPTPRRNGNLLSPQTTLALLNISHSLRLFDFGSSNHKIVDFGMLIVKQGDAVV